MYIDDDKTVFMPLSENDEVTQSELNQQDDPAGKDAREFTSESLFQKVSRLEYMFGPNKIMRHASEIFTVHYQVVNRTIDYSADKLKVVLSDGLTKFTIRCQQDGVSDKVLKSAQYIICSFIDEAILASSYGQRIRWSQQSMLSTNFNESLGGETFFKIRLFCLDNIAEYIEVFELSYMCMCLGFKGQYANKANGELMLERLKRESYDVICQYREIHDDIVLSKSWQSDYEPKIPIKHKYSFSIFFGVTLFVLAITYGGLSFFMHQTEAPVLKDIQQTKTQLENSTTETTIPSASVN